MLSLAEYQRAFADFLKAPPNPEGPVVLANAVCAPGMPAQDRLAVYKNNVAMRMMEALEAAYPAIRSLVGDEFFRFAAREYALRHPPDKRTLLMYGGDFSEFLRDFEPAQSLPYLPHVARLERLWLTAYHAPDAEPVEAAELAPALEHRPERVTLRLHPSAGLMSSPLAASRIWQVARSTEPIEQEIEILDEGEFLLVIRPEAEVEVRILAAGTYWLMTMLMDGASVTRALRAAAQVEPGRDLERDLRVLIRDKTFCDFTL